MIMKEVETKIEGLNNAFFVEEQYVDEPISKNIDSSINDFYNLMHLVKKSWVNKKYLLESKDAGYNIYDKNKNLVAWIGIKEKYESLMFIIFSDLCGCDLYKNAKKVCKGKTMEVLDFNEDWWVYSELNLTDILKGDSFKKQNKIVKSWINDSITEIL
jgi:hypothetical protein